MSPRDDVIAIASKLFHASCAEASGENPEKVRHDAEPWSQWGRGIGWANTLN
jgi:hypothetical protein